MTDIYQVQEGDTIEKLANMFNTTIDNILKENNLDYTSQIYPGMKVVIPGNREDYYNTYIVKKGDSLFKIAENYNINPKLLAAFNGLNYDDYIYPDQEIMLPKSGYSYYLTAEGDTLDGVAQIFGSNEEKLLNENKTIYLLPGQLIVNKK
jgi:LysM repeat protein